MSAHCTHPVLTFGSGDYYIFCAACRRKWCLHANDRPEYNADRTIGAAPELAQGNFHNEEANVLEISREVRIENLARSMAVADGRSSDKWKSFEEFATREVGRCLDILVLSQGAP